MGEDLTDVRAESVEALSRASSLLLTTELNEDMKNRGSDAELASYIANAMIDCRSRIEAGWMPGPNYGGQWVRLVMERITSTIPPDSLDRSIEEVSVALRHLAEADRACPSSPARRRFRAVHSRCLELS